MLINIPDSRTLVPLLQRKSLSAEQLYLGNGQRLPAGLRLMGESVWALETELSHSVLLYLQAEDLFQELGVCYQVLRKALNDDDPETFLPVLQELASRFRHMATHHFDLAYAYLSWHTADDYPIMHHMLVALTLVRVGMRSGRLTDNEIDSVVKAALTMNISMLGLQAKLREQSEPLSREQREAIRKHPEDSAKKLKLLGVTDPLWLQTVLLHHELPDGSGYPNQVDNKHPGSVLLGVCDSFNARMAQREYRGNFTAEQAVKDLFAQGDALCSDFTAILVEQLGVYPAGSLLQLEGNQIACSLIRGETAISPVVLAFRNVGGEGHPCLLDSAQDGCAIRAALPRRDLGELPTLLELLSKVV